MSSSLQKFNYAHMEALLGKPFDPVYAFMRLVPYMVESARTAATTDAHSYRGFHVAGSMYAINEIDKLAIQDSAGNLRRSVKEKVCAEKKLLGRATKAEATHIVGLVVLGTSNQEAIQQVSDLATPTLHFCSVCRVEVPEHPAVRRSTLAVTSGLESDVNQTFNVGQIQDLYARADKGDIDDSLFRGQPDFTDWEQRLATYSLAIGRLQEAGPSLEIREVIAQMAMSRTLTS